MPASEELEWFNSEEANRHGEERADPEPGGDAAGPAQLPVLPAVHLVNLPAEAMGGFPESTGASSQLCAGAQAVGSESVSSVPLCELFRPLMICGIL